MTGLVSLFVVSCASQQADKCSKGKSCIQSAPKQIQVSVDCSKQIGKIKALNGVNFGPKISSESAGSGSVFRKEFYDLNVHSVRTHDISLQNPGLMIGDTDMIFPLFHADVNDPRNYIFKPTDDYLQISAKEGAKIIFRLGVSIDHSKNKYRTWMPEPKKWAQICCNIIAHYNEGWANGYKMGIEYWEIWNEPEVTNPDGGHLMWAGNLKQFNDFYCEVAKIIKKRFPNIKIGGPAHTSAYSKKLGYEFLKRASEAGAPVDFYSWHYYGKDLKNLKEQVRIVRKWADDLGFKNTELHLNEWHYKPMSWADLRGKNAKKDLMFGLEAGVFASSIMTLWQDEPLDVSNYYTYGPGGWGLVQNGGIIFKSYYPFKAFGELVRYPNRLATTTSDEMNASVLAGRDSKGKTAILVNVFKQGKSNVVVDLKNCTFDLTRAQVLICDDDKNLEPADNVKVYPSKLEIPVKSDSACILIKL